MNQPRRRLNLPTPAPSRARQPLSSPTPNTSLRLPRPQEPPTRRGSRRPAPYRYAPSRRQAATSQRAPRPQPPAPAPNPAVKLSTPYTAPAASKLAPLPKSTERSGQLVPKRQSTDPALAIHLLREIEEVVVGWQRELKQILVQLQNLYLEGPMINGWLESDPSTTNGTTTQPYPNGLVSNGQATYPAYQGQVSYELPQPQYRLCGRNEQGEIWSKICPPNQVTAVSMAIARYQKLCQLLKKKQGLEHRLSNIAHTLVRVHNTLKQ
ncbi:MAG: hypothetical protein F6J87_23755 [Spirulina sp. SIO3F2]|nr:hypothetical protein [Spirulina sp. SIO3F2]